MTCMTVAHAGALLADSMRLRVPKVIPAVEATLAEGGHVERDKATGLMRLWGVSGIDAEAAGRDIDLVVDRCRHENRVASVMDLDEQQRSTTRRHQRGGDVAPSACVSSSIRSSATPRFAATGTYITASVGWTRSRAAYALNALSLGPTAL
jgi:hypothetical protein